jgi:hypothetical protein
MADVTVLEHDPDADLIARLRPYPCVTCGGLIAPLQGIWTQGGGPYCCSCLPTSPTRHRDLVRSVVEALLLGETFDSYRQARERACDDYTVDMLARSIVDHLVAVAAWDGDAVAVDVVEEHDDTTATS